MESRSALYYVRVSWRSYTVLIVLLCAIAAPKPLLGRPKFAFDLLANQSFIGERLSSPEPFGSQVDKVHALFRVRPRFNLGRGFELQTPLGIVLPGNAGADGTVTVFRSHMGLLISRRFATRWSIAVGPGIEWRNFFSQGGPVVLRNGTDSSTFYIPSQSQAMALFVTCATIEWFWKERISISGDLFIENLLNPQRRSFALAIGMGFHL